MARADLIAKLMKSAIESDQSSIVRVAEAIIADEREKHHNVLADRLASIIRRNGAESNRTGKMLDNGIASLIYEIVPEKKLSSLFLAKEVVTLMKELVEEYQRKELLNSYGLAPRNRIMLIGPPGNGKTSLAEALAHELMLPLVVVRYDGLIGSFLGQTASRLNKIFDHARQRNCVLFFDEFDAIGKERGDIHETGEIKRVVSSLLMQIDAVPSHTVVMVASNHAHLLDSAAWRRFQVRVELRPPTATARQKYIETYQRKTSLKFGVPAEKISKSLGTCSYAELEEFCRDVLRHAIMHKQRENAKNITNQKIKQWIQRSKLHKYEK